MQHHAAGAQKRVGKGLTKNGGARRKPDMFPCCEENVTICCCVFVENRPFLIQNFFCLSILLDFINGIVSHQKYILLGMLHIYHFTKQTCLMTLTPWMNSRSYVYNHDRRGPLYTFRTLHESYTLGGPCPFLSVPEVTASTLRV